MLKGFIGCFFIIFGISMGGFRSNMQNWPWVHDFGKLCIARPMPKINLFPIRVIYPSDRGKKYCRRFDF